MSLKLHLPNRTVPVEALAQNGRLTITGDGGIWFQLEGLTRDHILHGGEPGVFREEREPRRFVDGLSLADLDPALGPATLKAMLIEHFSLAGLSDIVEALLLDYKAETGRAYKPGHGSPDRDPQLARDLAAIEAIRAELLDEAGELRWGAQSRIAEALDIPNAGSYRPRILAVAEALAEQEAA